MWKILNLQKCCQKTAEISHTPFTSLSLMLISYIFRVQFLNQNINIGTYYYQFKYYFIQISSDFLLMSLSIIESKPGYHIALNYQFSLISSNPWQLLTLPLSFMIFHNTLGNNYSVVLQNGFAVLTVSDHWTYSTHSGQKYHRSGVLYVIYGIPDVDIT